MCSYFNACEVAPQVYSVVIDKLLYVQQSKDLILLICIKSLLSPTLSPPSQSAKRRAISGIVVKAGLTEEASESAIYLMFSSLLLHSFKRGRTRGKESAAPGWVGEEEIGKDGKTVNI